MAEDATNGISRVWVPLMAAVIAAVIAGMTGIIIGKGEGDLDLKYIGIMQQKEYSDKIDNRDASREKEIADLTARVAAMEGHGMRINTLEYEAKGKEKEIASLVARIANLEGSLNTALMSKRAAK
jgi:hypothetical protein